MDIDKKNITGDSGIYDLFFDSRRPITNPYEEGDSIGQTNLPAVAEWLYLKEPTISLSTNPSTSIYEVGTINSIDINVNSVSNGYTLSKGLVYITSEDPDHEIIDFGSGSFGSITISFSPQVSELGFYTDYSYTFRGQQDYSGDLTGTMYTSSITKSSAFPTFWGVLTDSYADSSGQSIYNAGLTKQLWTPGNKTVTFDGTGYAHFIVPQEMAAWTVVQIKDHNNFPITTGFTFIPVTVDSDGLSNEWMGIDYVMIIANNVAGYDNYDFQFNTVPQ